MKKLIPDKLKLKGLTKLELYKIINKTNGAEILKDYIDIMTKSYNDMIDKVNEMYNKCREIENKKDSE